jgi:hypothetical protein
VSNAVARLGSRNRLMNPKLVVQKAARVVRPGGTVVIFDGDYATMTFGVDREMDERIISGVIANPRVMRPMPRLLREVGLKPVDSRAWVLTEIGRADFFRILAVISRPLAEGRRSDS